MLHALDFFKELVGDDGDIGVFDTRLIKDVDDGIGHQGLVYHLADSCFDLDIAEATVARLQLPQTGLNGLKEGDFLALGDRLGVVSGQGIDFGEGGDGIEKAVFALGVGNIVGGGFEQVEFVAGAGGEIGGIVKACHDALDHF